MSTPLNVGIVGFGYAAATFHAPLIAATPGLGLVAGELGRLTHFESHFDRYRPEVRVRWRESGVPGSGLWYDLGSHLLDQVLQLFGEPSGGRLHT